MEDGALYTTNWLNDVSNALYQVVAVLRFFSASSLHRIGARHDGKQHVTPSLDEPDHISITPMRQQNPSEGVEKPNYQPDMKARDAHGLH